MQLTAAIIGYDVDRDEYLLTYLGEVGGTVSGFGKTRLTTKSLDDCLTFIKNHHRKESFIIKASEIERGKDNATI